MQLSSPPVTPMTRLPSSSTNQSPTASSTQTPAASDAMIHVKRRGEATAVAIAMTILEKLKPINWHEAGSETLSFKIQKLTL